MTTYTTKQGDMWDIIAKALYGSEKYAENLMKANKAHLSTIIFSAGVALTVPEANITSSTSKTVLPPWRT